ncbi:8-oxoguanine deaminase [Oceanicola sp. 502str15]|uniref:8-oxoguanine deaminase n=1 Tax=Oceanicola sp. 502str15 TaxID=2696061 RepID=UPI0020950153|nr:8-oxoguanine deaminase [Oceanicola sp. 502str15]MCO6381388.1 8-oxoguanine deaminase [Oceanicola sp. 502str15]
MTHRLIRGGHVLCMDDAGREGVLDIRLRGGVIEEIGPGLAAGDAQVLGAEGCLVTPGLVNTHHHMFQSLTRAVPAGQDALLFGWLKALYPIWGRMTPQDIRLSARLASAELALSGCSMSSDHLYLFPNGARLEDSIEGAGEVGIRFLATRGAMSIGESSGGLPPDALVEDEAAILEDCARVVDAFHDPSEAAMVQVGIAPCSPFSVSRELMRDAAILAREKGVRLHTHLAENEEDIAYSQANFGCRPGQYAQELGWVGDDVWHAHCVKLDSAEIDLFAHTRTGVAHCPCSNCRLGSGIAPVRAMRDAGVPVGLGVDGSASNDAGNLAAEARMALLMARVRDGANAMPAREALAIATRGGAEVLGRGRHLGRLAPGYRADLALWDMSGVEAAGNWDRAALLLAGPMRVRDLFVEGRAVVQAGVLLGVDMRALAQEAAAAVERLANGG